MITAAAPKALDLFVVAALSGVVLISFVSAESQCGQFMRPPSVRRTTCRWLAKSVGQRSGVQEFLLRLSDDLVPAAGISAREQVVLELVKVLITRVNCRKGDRGLRLHGCG